MNNRKIKYLLLAIIFFVGLILRVYKLETIPSGFHQDEAANAYMGKFVLLNGKDFYGNPFPIFYIDKWGDYPPALPMYFAGAGSILFSDTVFGARIIIALMGALTVLSVYFLAKNLFGKEKTALFSSLFTAILPWHIAFSRTAAEGTAALFFYTTALALFFRNSQNLKKITDICIFASLLITYLSYPSFRIIIPATLLFLLILKKIETKRLHRYTLFLLLFFTTATLWISTTEWGSARLRQTSILKAVKDRQDFYNQFIFEDKTIFLARLFHNKAVNLAEEFLRQYFSYFSLLYLFVEGGRPEWYRFPNSGLLYLTNLILVISASVFALKKTDIPVNKKRLILMLFILFTAPIPAALTIEHSIHMHRSIAMILPFVLLSAVGTTALKLIPYKKTAVFLLFFLLTAEFVKFSHNYFVHVSSYSSLHRSEANKYAAIYLVENRRKYKDVYFFITGWFPVYYLYFSSNYSPEIIGKLKRMYTPKLDNINFIAKNCPEQKDIDPLPQKSLVMFSSICDPKLYRSLKMIKAIKNISDTNIFWVFEKTK